MTTTEYNTTPCGARHSALATGYLGVLKIESELQVKQKQGDSLERLGFSCERGGVHTARTMMLAELRVLLSSVDQADALKVEYLEAIQTANCRASSVAPSPLPLVD